MGTGYTGSAEIDGAVRSLDGQALAGVHVISVETGEEVLSDSNGAFLLTVAHVPHKITLAFSWGAHESTMPLSNLPAGDNRIDLEVQIDLNSDFLRVSAFSITPLNPPTPTAAPSPNGGSSATPTPNNVLRGSIYRGLVLYDNSLPVVGVRVTHLEARESSTTDASGHFTINTDSTGGTVTLRFSWLGRQSDLTLRNIPRNTDVIVDLTIRIGGRSIQGGSPFPVQGLPILSPSIRIRPR